MNAARTAGKSAAPESDPAWAPGDEGRTEFYAYLLRQGGELYAGHTRDLRERLWEHRSGSCMATSPANAGEPACLVWFQTFDTRAEAADRELELKQLLLRDRRAALAMVFRFQDAARLVCRCCSVSPGTSRCYIPGNPPMVAFLE